MPDKKTIIIVDDEKISIFDFDSNKCLNTTKTHGKKEQITLLNDTIVEIKVESTQRFYDLKKRSFTAKPKTIQPNSWYPDGIPYDKDMLYKTPSKKENVCSCFRKNRSTDNIYYVKKHSDGYQTIAKRKGFDFENFSIKEKLLFLFEKYNSAPLKNLILYCIGFKPEPRYQKNFFKELHKEIEESITPTETIISIKEKESNTKTSEEETKWETETESE